MEPIAIPQNRKPILQLLPRHKRHIRHAVGVGLIIALIGAIAFNLAAPGGQAATL